MVYQQFIDIKKKEEEEIKKQEQKQKQQINRPQIPSLGGNKLSNLNFGGG